MKTKSFAMLSAVILMIATGTAQAGFKVTFENIPTNIYGIALPDGTLVPGSFTDYFPDGPYDPVIAPGDLANFHLNSVNNQSSLVLNSTLNTATISGNYTITYGPGSSIVVSTGTYTNVTTITDFGSSSTPVLGDVVGTLHQTSGPNNPAFRDLSYGGNPVHLTAKYTGDGVNGLITGELIQEAVAAPEPATLGSALVAFVGGLMYYRRSRRSRTA